MLVIRQKDYLIDSTERGMQLVRDNKNYAVIGGRETFYYDIKRFGKNIIQYIYIYTYVITQPV